MAANLNNPQLEDDDFPEPPRLKRLRLMVMAVMAALGVGVLFIAGAVGWRVIQEPDARVPLTAEQVALPQGADITAIGADGAALMITARMPDGAEKLFVFAKSDGRLLEETRIARDE